MHEYWASSLLQMQCEVITHTLAINHGTPFSILTCRVDFFTFQYIVVFTKVKMSEMPPLSAISLYFIWSQSVEQLPPIWWFVSYQTEFEQVFLLKLSLGGCSVWVCQHLLRILENNICETYYYQCVQKKMNKVAGCRRHTLFFIPLCYLHLSLPLDNQCL